MIFRKNIGTDIKHALTAKTEACTYIELYIYTQILTVIMLCTDKLAKLLPSATNEVKITIA